MCASFSRHDEPNMSGSFMKLNNWVNLFQAALETCLVFLRLFVSTLGLLFKALEESHRVKQMQYSKLS